MSGAEAPGPSSGGRRRGPRRAQRPATGGVPQDGAAGSRAGRSSDDTDLGWGERPVAPDDERYLRERPPHWG